MNTRFWEGKRVLVTGHTGFKGAWLSLWLQELDADVTGYALPAPTSPSLFDVATVGIGMTSVTGDVRDGEAVARTFREARPEIVIHMAAQSMVREGHANPVDTYAINAMGTVHVLEAARTTPGVRAVINVTTDKCYETREGQVKHTESDPLGGDDPYSNSKACAELVTSAYGKSFFSADTYSSHGVALASARAGNAVGGGDWGRYRLIPDMIRAFETGQPVNIRSPHALRPWLHVLEPLSGYLLLAERLYSEGPVYGGAWNFSAQDEDIRPVQWVADRLVSLWGEGAAWTLDANPEPREKSTSRLDCSRAHASLGWHQRWDLGACLAKLVEWHKSYIEGQDMREVTIRQLAPFAEACRETGTAAT